MTDQQALLAAIISAPDEDTPRLVYADWLQENGEEHRAEYIRAQIEIAQYETVTISPTTAMRWTASQEVHSYLAQSPYVMEQLFRENILGQRSSTAQYGLPESMFGIKIVVKEGVADDPAICIEAIKRRRDCREYREARARSREASGPYRYEGEYGERWYEWFGHYTGSGGPTTSRGFIDTVHWQATRWVREAPNIYWNPKSNTSPSLTAQPLSEVIIDNDAPEVVISSDHRLDTGENRTIVYGDLRFDTETWSCRHEIPHRGMSGTDMGEMSNNAINLITEKLRLEHIFPQSYPGVKFRISNRIGVSYDPTPRQYGILSPAYSPQEMVRVVRSTIEQYCRDPHGLVDANDTVEWLPRPNIASPWYEIVHLHNGTLARMSPEATYVADAIERVTLRREAFHVHGSRYDVYIGRCPECRRAFITEPVCRTG